SLLLLVSGCTNIMNLLLSRGPARSREVAIRAALGAQRSRLLRQLLTETICLSAAACGLGILIARGALTALLRVLPIHLPISGTVGLDLRVLGFAIAITVL